MWHDRHCWLAGATAIGLTSLLRRCFLVVVACRHDHMLLGRDINIADVVTPHTSCSRQHAVIQFRLDAAQEGTSKQQQVRPAHTPPQRGSYLSVCIKMAASVQHAAAEAAAVLRLIACVRACMQAGAAARIQPYLLDLGSTNGSFINGKPAVTREGSVCPSSRKVPCVTLQQRHYVMLWYGPLQRRS